MMRRIRLLPSLLLLLFASGCACKQVHPPQVPAKFEFRGCVSKRGSDGKVECDCPKARWQLDAQTGKPYLQCGAAAK